MPLLIMIIIITGEYKLNSLLSLKDHKIENIEILRKIKAKKGVMRKIEIMKIRLLRAVVFKGSSC
ncbi:hypothetical protein FIN95_12590 [Yersinia pestis]|nr:hypothetical protein FIN95_12590 [Yersinia pestis]